MTFRHLATVVEMVDSLSFEGLDAAGVDDGGGGGGDTPAAVVKGCKGLEDLRGGAAGGWPAKEKAVWLEGGAKGGCPRGRRGGGPGGGPGGCPGRRGGGPGGGPAGSPTRGG